MATQTLNRRAPDASVTAPLPSIPERIVDNAGSLEHQLLPDPAGDEQIAPRVWMCRLPASGEIIAIVRTEADAEQVPSQMPAFTLAEVAIAIEAFGQATLAAKRTFPGALITAVRDRSPEMKTPPARSNGNQEHSLTSRPKPLPPSGSYASLSRKMPKDTRYKGESYPSSNPKARYEEHMAKQRAAVRSREEVGDE